MHIAHAFYWIYFRAGIFLFVYLFPLEFAQNFQYLDSELLDCMREWANDKTMMVRMVRVIRQFRQSKLDHAIL